MSYNSQEQEERDFHRMTPHAYNEEAVKQEGYKTPARRWLLTDYDTWVVNPFWDGTEPSSHPEAVQQELEEEYREAVHLAETKSTEDGGCPDEPNDPDLPF